jgi:hypothetical protein
MKINPKINEPIAEKRIILHGQAPGSFASPQVFDAGNTVENIFLLSPANASGRRARLLLNGAGNLDLARRLQTAGAMLGDLFSFMSSLYFRGKLTYARTFSRGESEFSEVFIITPSRGLLSPATLITRADLLEMATCTVDAENPLYRIPLQKSARALQEKFGAHSNVVLLGSIASPKYVEPLGQIFAERLLFPAEFVGRGDMSRGGLLLRHAEQRSELRYIPVCSATLRGPRAKKLAPGKRKK